MEACSSTAARPSGWCIEKGNTAIKTTHVYFLVIVTDDLNTAPELSHP